MRHGAHRPAAGLDPVLAVRDELRYFAVLEVAEPVFLVEQQ